MCAGRVFAAAPTEGDCDAPRDASRVKQAGTAAASLQTPPLNRCCARRLRVWCAAGWADTTLDASCAASFVLCCVCCVHAQTQAASQRPHCSYKNESQSVLSPTAGMYATQCPLYRIQCAVRGCQRTCLAHSSGAGKLCLFPVSALDARRCVQIRVFVVGFVLRHLTSRGGSKVVLRRVQYTISCRRWPGNVLTPTAFFTDLLSSSARGRNPQTPAPIATCPRGLLTPASPRPASLSREPPSHLLSIPPPPPISPHPPVFTSL